MLDWLFKSKKGMNLNLSHIGIDIHSHLIPGIDDGVQTIEEAVSMARKMQNLGYSQIITTPHVMWDCYRNTPEIILSGLEKVRRACVEEGLSIQIDAAAEYFLDEHFGELLNRPQELLTMPGNRILVELPYSTPLLNTSETLFAILERGYQPVLAHPERYTYFYSDPSIYQKLVHQGCELQINILSVTGFYGDGIRRMAEWLLKNSLITFLGTDAHKIEHLQMIRGTRVGTWLNKYPFQNEKLIKVQGE
ncbi:tyrosine-protein phosphatase [Dyadobacter sp. CY343]|uniref:tyrosine-protein phosphatase n=1 Tax=Dyadobacter sp. CY343 TaxID=2907299 RepID=UPI001F4280B4|nr:CpsB/CapC family capsule biosynthesis tyrosine phosphatase [Dyadobacter sp. CY343]MCE7059714.1 histidinol phosphatase [Dyadobacter sp. CY343]